MTFKLFNRGVVSPAKTNPENNMKNRFGSLAVLLLLLALVLGCNFGSLTGSGDSESGSGDSSSSSSESSETSSSSDGDLVEVGIPECDELATYINDRAETIGEESIVVRGIVEMYKQTIFSGLKESVEKMDDKQKEQMAENCKKSLENLKKQMEDK
ncbi:MAG: hypothetical protein DWQ47_01750 [Acidobacteria bacterium]|nr:MAG: hypothetical protein DWQ32_05300 [Acidobacteriota bacterium]REK01148.1 MAG: hypothetical protein DWQ38_01735 [Acidobacteriota bacterium]REK14104.1 MAG: hypothetical protein DWQ43_10990 [Acidobacteriota bacterium]REK44819.1 MAG: hypothetical protein DWQ47_01750 [Acidobacteriota bacterium]